MPSPPPMPPPSPLVFLGEALPVTSGTGRFFLLRGNTELLDVIRVEQARILVTSSSRAGILFVETHQFSWLKRRGQGSLVAMRTKHRYTLAILVGVDLDTALYIPLDKGLASIESATGESGEFVSYKRQSMGKDSEVVFLNMVWAHSSLDNCSNRVKADTKDASDGCYSFSKSGPDSAFWPTGGPTVYGNLQLFIKVAPTLPRLLSNNLPPFPPRPKPNIGPVTIVVVAQDAICEEPQLGVPLGPNKHTGSGRLFPIPRLRQGVVGSRMALVPQERVHRILDLEGISVDEYEALLDEVMVAELCGMHVVDYGASNYSIASCRDVDIQSISGLIPTGNSNIGMLQGGTLLQLTKLVGNRAHILAAGGPLLPPSMASIDRRLPDAMVSVYGPRGSMPTRGRAASIGHQSYIGTRGSPAMRVTPLFGPSDITRHDYWTQGVKNIHKIVALLPTLNAMVSAVKCLARSLHRFHLGFLENTVCLPKQCVQDTMNTIRLVTFGLENSYASTIHSDRLDIFEPGLQESLLKSVNSFGVKKKRNKRGSFQCTLSKHGQEYLKSWIERFGSLDAPTTCGHAGWIDPPTGAILYHFFVMDSLGVSARIGPGTMHSFFASRFTHATSIGVMVLDGKVWTKHPSLGMLAWGAGKTAAQIEAGARRRVQRRRERHDIQFGII